MNNVEIINNLVYKGLISIAFINSQIVKIINNNTEKSDEIVYLNKIYKQKYLPEANSQVLTSKIYDLH
jgi:hypothetical protein